MSLSDDELKTEIDKLGPWHHQIELRDGITTKSHAQTDSAGSRVSYIEPAKIFYNSTKKLLPGGMSGRTFLDCGCNAGGYCFAAKDAGASSTFGFDVRDHWINQANFVRTHRSSASDGMRFEVADLLDLSGMKEDFDVTWFSGLLYHLPDPVTGLKIAADRTKELIFVNTTVAPTEANEVEIPALYMKFEGTKQLMSGVHTMSWHPAGAETVRKLLNWMGFPETRLAFWIRKMEANVRGDGRLLMIGARETGRLSAMVDAEPSA